VKAHRWERFHENRQRPNVGVGLVGVRAANTAQPGTWRPDLTPQGDEERNISAFGRATNFIDWCYLGRRLAPAEIF
jgi:hypothetical protein